MLSNNRLCLPAAVQYVLLFFSTDGKFRPVSNFMQLHTLTLATRSYTLLSEKSQGGVSGRG